MTSLFRPRLLAACSLLALIASSIARAESPFDFARTPGKLPKTVVPDAYRIDLTPDLDKLTLSGSEAIELRVLQAGTDIVLNQAGLTWRTRRWRTAPRPPSPSTKKRRPPPCIFRTPSPPAGTR